MDAANAEEPTGSNWSSLPARKERKPAKNYQGATLAYY